MSGNFSRMITILRHFEYGEMSLTRPPTLRSQYASQAEELEQQASATDRLEKQGHSHMHAPAPHGSTEAPAGGRGHSHMLHRMSPPKHPLPRPPGHPPRPFAASRRDAGAGSNGSGMGDGGMGALLGVASQLRPPRVSIDYSSRSCHLK